MIRQETILAGLNIITRVPDYIRSVWREFELNRNAQETLRVLSPDFTVKHGPFKGMIYPVDKIVGIRLAVKLLGSYERELQPMIEQICSNEYTEIVNIGCGEGYYAVGLAMRNRTVKVFAYDKDRRNIRLCKKMARMNNVAERLVTGSFCDANTLRAVPLTTKALIICDCEGYEKKLFTEGLVPFLANHDLLIEVHDCFDSEISSVIRQLFERTHVIETIQSIDDITKAHSYSYEELHGYDLPTRKLLLAESRQAIMEWFYMTPRPN
ncbi:MAG: class I SAM-dependent methyltransferase [Chloroflexota bacterium]